MLYRQTTSSPIYADAAAVYDKYTIKFTDDVTSGKYSISHFFRCSPLHMPIRILGIRQTVISDKLILYVSYLILQLKQPRADFTA